MMSFYIIECRNQHFLYIDIVKGYVDVKSGSFLLNGNIFLRFGEFSDVFSSWMMFRKHLEGRGTQPRPKWLSPEKFKKSRDLLGRC